jgi:hypothetical protein
LVDPDHEMVLIARWLDGKALNPLVEKTVAALSA